MTKRSTPSATNPLKCSVQTLKGVGPSVATKLEKLDIHTVGDLLFHLPLRYQDRTRISPVGALRDGMEISVEGEITHSEVAFRRRRMLLCKLSDGSGSLTLRFFHFNDSQRKALKTGTRVRCFGEVRGGFDRLEMVHPELQYNPDAFAATAEEQTLTPLYPVTDGVHQLTLRRLTDQALTQVQGVKELIPGELRQASNPMELAEAVRYLHRPPADADVRALMEGEHPAQQRLAIEELVAHQLSMMQLRQTLNMQPGIAFNGAGELSRQFLENLPFQLTNAQQRVFGEIAGDLSQPRPMMRLLQGDVGSGKTVVAALACLACVEAGYQAVVMAPTEILAEQHRQNLTAWFEPLGIETAWITGKQKVAVRRDMLERVATGVAQVVVGTHALFQDDTVFSDLAMVVIDEQHRFGVHQRMALRDKGKNKSVVPHQLIMTATPIPRTLAQTAYADLDLSIIDERPPGRTPVKTVAMGNERRAEVVEHVARACREGRQCYWVCTLVEESEALDAEAAEVTHVGLQEALPDLKIGLVHGRMKAPEKEAAMHAFKQGGTQLLVATTVIEVGVDVPNASLMIIDNAERLGLSQLHQLRGRVGRGSVESACLLMYQSPLSETGRQRIDAMRKTDDGFEIARIDMEIRGPGELLGVRQTGLMKFRVADLNRDAELVPQAVRVAHHLLHHHPKTVQPLVDRWIGSKAQYREV